MMESPGFGVLLGRLLAHRRAGPATVARAAGVSASELDAVLAGGHASALLLRRLAPALGLHTADLFVIAGHDVPADLAPARGTRPWHVGHVMQSAMRLFGKRFDRLHEFIRSLPALLPAEPLPPPTRSPAGPGALVMGLLANRNIRPHIAQLLYFVGDGPYVSDSTIYRVVHGDSALTARYVTAFAAVLGFPAGDLAALTGVGPPVDTARLYPRRAELAAVAWDARRLNSEQLSQVQQLAFDLARVGARK
ncbi:XRE family transcriptional regulator [Micromonospora sp. NPDC048930]|uniref:XRE family transcriptional regulator n=1 Tax=Micromonospora sp. NPDC048930 TaxID=3364261 RepID=UPI003717FDB5